MIRIDRRLRPSILAMMSLVVLIAVVLGWVAADRRKQVAALHAELSRQRDRVGWAERMQPLGYVSKATLAAERTRLKQVQSRLVRLGIPRNGP